MVPPRHLLLALVAGVLALGSALAGDAPPAPASLSGTIRDVKGKPMAGAIVSVEGGGETRTAKDGTWTIPGVAPGDALVTARVFSHGRVQTLLRVAAGESRRWDATVGPAGQIRGRVVDEYGHPLTRLPGWDKDSGWKVAAQPQQEWMSRPDAESWDCLTEADGSFRLRVSPDALFQLCVWRTDMRAWVLLTEPMSGGLSDITLRVLPAKMRARLRCRLEDFDGKAVTGPQVPEGQKGVSSEAQLLLRWVDVSNWGRARYGGHLRFDASQGAWISNQVSPGTYAVVTGISGTRAFEFPTVEVRDAADVDLGTLRFPKPGRVRFVASRSGVRSDADVRLSLWRVRSFEDLGWRWGHFGVGGSNGPELIGDAVSAWDLCPGLYYATFHTDVPPDVGFEYVEVPFEVRPGETTNVTIPVRRAPLYTMRLRVPGPDPSQAWVAVSDAGGVIVCSYPISYDLSKYVECRWDIPIRLVPGHYDVVVLTSDRRRLTGTLEIPAEDAPETFDVVAR